MAASFDDDAIYDPPVKETEKDRVIKLRVPPEIQAQILPQIDPIVRFWHQSPFDMTSYCLMGTKDGVFLSAMGVGSLKYETSGPHVAHPFNYSYTLTCRQLVNRRVPTGCLVTGAIEVTSKKYGHYVIRFEALVHLRPQPDWDAVEPVDAEITWYGPVVEKQ